MTTTLRRYLQEHGPLPPDRALALFRALAGACAANGGRSVGRRLRPEGITLDAAGNPSLGDRSVTSPYDDRYLPGDLHRGEAPDVRADLFALGVILFEALTGRHPDLWELPGEARPGVPPRADELYRRCTSPPARRFRTWAEALEFLDGGGNGVPAAAAAGPASAPAPSALRLILAAAAGVLAGFALGWWARG